jgi:uncharacterized repeat protein (TIGR01451 family)
VPRDDVPIAPTLLITTNLIDSSSFTRGSTDPNIHSVSGIPNRGSDPLDEFAATCSNPAVAVGLGGSPSACNNKWGLPLQAYGPGSYCFSKEFASFSNNAPGIMLNNKCNGPYTASVSATPGATLYPNLLLFKYPATTDYASVMCDTVTKNLNGDYLFNFSGKLGQQDGDQVGAGYYDFIGNIASQSFLNNGTEIGYLDIPSTHKYFDGSTVHYRDFIDKIQYSSAAVGLGVLNNINDDCGSSSNDTGWMDWDPVTNSVPGATLPLTKFRLVTKSNLGQWAVNRTSSNYIMFVNVAPQIKLNNDPSVFSNFATENNFALSPNFSGLLANFGHVAIDGTTQTNAYLPKIGTSNPYNLADQAYDRLNGASDLAYIIPAQLTLQKSASVYAANAGDTVTYTLTPNFSGSSITENISITDTYDSSHMDLVAGSITNCSPTVVSAGCSYIVAGNVITFTIANQQAGVAIPAITYQGKIKSAVTNADIPNSAEATTLLSPAAHNGDSCRDADANPANGAELCDIKSQRQAAATVRVRTSGSFLIEKKVTKTVQPTNTDLRYDLYSKDLSADPIAPQEYIDIFPHNADNAGTTFRSNPSNFTGTTRYGNLAAERINGAGTASAVTPTQLLWTSANPITINQDPKCASNTGGVSSPWTLDSPASTSLSSANPNANDWSLYCPAGDTVTVWNTGTPASNTTAIKWVMPALNPNDSYHFTLDLKARNNKETDKYTNNFSARAPSVVSGAPTQLELPIISNDVTIVVVDGSIGDRVWYDTNRNGLQDSGELGIPNVPVKLTYAGPDGILGDGSNAASADDQIFTTITNATGDYIFNFLPAGTYSVEVTTPPSNTLPTYDLDDTNPLVVFTTPNKTITTLSATTNPTTGELIAIQDRTNADFGYVRTGSIGDLVYYDNNNNGQYDPTTDVGIDGVTVQLKCPGLDGILGDGTNASSADDMILTTTTGDNPDTTGVVEKGYYQFKNIPFSPLCVVTILTPPATTDYTQSGDPDGSKDNKAVLPISLDTPTSPNNSSNQTGDFGYAPLGQVGDTIFEDTNRNGTQDPREPGIPGVVVKFICPGVDGILGDGINVASADDMLLGTATTDANGKYSITNLPYNPNCSVVVVTPTDYELTSDPDSTKDGKTVLPLTIGAKSNLTGDFGYAPLASLGDYIWADKNKDGIQDAGEKALAGVKIELLDANGIAVNDPHKAPGSPYVLTSTAAGFYRFTGLQPGTYKVKFSNLPAGAKFTQLLGNNASSGSDASSEGFTQSVTLSAGQSNLTLDAGIVLADTANLSNTGQSTMIGVIVSSLVIIAGAVVIRRRRQAVYLRGQK